MTINVEKFVAGLHDYLERAFNPVCARLKALETRLAALEGKAVIDYRGVWSAEESYIKGQFCTHSGGLWHCNADTSTPPGSGPHWTLAVKAGRDAR